MKFKTLVLLSLLITACTEQSSKIDLAGIWQITTDSTEWKNTIQLPGSMTSNNLGEDISLSTDWTGGIVNSSYYHNEKYRKYRQKGNIKVPFWLQPLKYYKGAAWYKREIVIPKSWEKKKHLSFLGTMPLGDTIMDR